MKLYEWKNQDGKVVEHDHWSEPPNLPGKWKRVFSFAVATVEGGGGSPARSSVVEAEDKPKPTNQVVKIGPENVRMFN